MYSSDETRRIQDDATLADDRLSRGEDTPPSGTEVFLGHTVSLGNYPTAANVFYAVEIDHVLGDEYENAPADVTAQGRREFAYNHGTDVPPPNTPVLVSYVPFRFTFKYP